MGAGRGQGGKKASGGPKTLKISPKRHKTRPEASDMPSGYGESACILSKPLIKWQTKTATEAEARCVENGAGAASQTWKARPPLTGAAELRSTDCREHRRSCLRRSSLFSAFGGAGCPSPSTPGCRGRASPSCREFNGKNTSAIDVVVCAWTRTNVRSKCRVAEM